MTFYSDPNDFNQVLCCLYEFQVQREQNYTQISYTRMTISNAVQSSCSQEIAISSPLNKQDDTKIGSTRASLFNNAIC